MPPSVGPSYIALGGLVWRHRRTQNQIIKAEIPTNIPSIIPPTMPPTTPPIIAPVVDFEDEEGEEVRACVMVS